MSELVHRRRSQEESVDLGVAETVFFLTGPERHSEPPWSTIAGYVLPLIRGSLERDGHRKDKKAKQLDTKLFGVCEMTQGRAPLYCEEQRFGSHRETSDACGFFVPAAYRESTAARQNTRWERIFESFRPWKVRPVCIHVSIIGAGFTGATPNIAGKNSLNRPGRPLGFTPERREFRVLERFSQKTIGRVWATRSSRSAGGGVGTQRPVQSPDHDIPVGREAKFRKRPAKIRPSRFSSTGGLENSFGLGRA